MDLTAWFPLSIYTLSDPRTGRVRYVGCSSQVKERFRVHFLASTPAPEIRRAWFAELRALGLKPVCDVIESGRHIGFADERKWIAYYLACGADLVNVVGTPAWRRHTKTASRRSDPPFLVRPSRVQPEGAVRYVPSVPAESTTTPPSLVGAAGGVKASVQP